MLFWKMHMTASGISGNEPSLEILRSQCEELAFAKTGRSEGS